MPTTIQQFKKGEVLSAAKLNTVRTAITEAQTNITNLQTNSATKSELTAATAGKFYGYVDASSNLPSGSADGYAYVGTAAPYAIWNFDSTNGWADSHSTLTNPVIAASKDTTSKQITITANGSTVTSDVASPELVDEKVDGLRTEHYQDIFDISEYHEDAVYVSLSDALGSSGANVPTNYRHGGMTIKFVQDNSNYSVTKEEGLETAPTGATVASSNPTSINNGTYKAAQLKTYFPVMPSVGTPVVYYWAVTGTTTTYTSWTISVPNSDNKYVQHRYTGTATTGSPNPFLDTANWQGVDEDLLIDYGNGLITKDCLFEGNTYATEYFSADYKINTNGKFGSNNSYKHIYIPVQSGEKYHIEGIADYVIRVAFATTNIATSGGNIPLVSGTSVVEIPANTSIWVKIPTGCTYLLLWRNDADDGFSIDKVRVIDAVPESGSKNLVESGGVFDVEFGINKNISVEISSYVEGDYRIKSDGNFASTASNKHAIVYVNQGEKYIIENNDNLTSVLYYCFATSDSATAGGIIPLVSGTSVQSISNGNSSLIEIPSGCSYLLFNTTGFSVRLLSCNNVINQTRKEIAASTEYFELAPSDIRYDSYIKDDGSIGSADGVLVYTFVNIDDKLNYRFSFKQISSSNKADRVAIAFYSGAGTFISGYTVYYPADNNKDFDGIDIKIPTGASVVKVTGSTSFKPKVIRNNLINDLLFSANRAEIDFEPIIGSVFLSRSRKVVLASVADYKSTCIKVSPHERYIIYTTAYTSYGSVYITDKNANIITTYSTQITNVDKSVLFMVEIPQNSTFMFVNCYGLGRTLSIEAISTFNSLNDERVNGLSEYGGYYISNDALTHESNTTWISQKVEVPAGSLLKICTTQYGSKYPNYIITDSQNNVLDIGEILGVSIDTRKSFSLYLKNDCFVYINNHIQTPFIPTTVEIKKIDDIDYNPTNIKIGSVNCGKFDYGDGTTTDEEYLANWHNMLNSMDYDILVLSDFINTFGDLQETAIEALFGGQYYKVLDIGITANFIVVSRLKNIQSISVIEVTQSEGGHRYKIYKVVLSLHNNTIYIYDVHLEPGEDQANARAIQYQDIVDLITNGDETAIIAGDFNAWTASEYDVFKSAGYNMGNCGYTGTHLTLRDIPADNIVTTPDVLIKKFEVIEGFTLNTDHKPILASITLG